MDKFERYFVFIYKFLQGHKYDIALIWIFKKTTCISLFVGSSYILCPLLYKKKIQSSLESIDTCCVGPEEFQSKERINQILVKFEKTSQRISVARDSKNHVCRFLQVDQILPW